MDILELIRERESSRVLFDPERTIPSDQMNRILEGARWAPTAHNMQNYEQLSFSEEELKRKKVGILGAMFPPSWRTPGVKPHVDEVHAHSILGAPIRMSAALLVVLYDPRRRAPASENDALGMMSLGCVMENMWLVAQSLGIGFHVQSSLGSPAVERDVRPILGFPEPLKIAFAVRLGYPKQPFAYLRVRRDLADFTHRKRHGRSPRARGATQRGARRAERSRAVPALGRRRQEERCAALHAVESPRKAVAARDAERDGGAFGRPGRWRSGTRLRHASSADSPDGPRARTQGESRRLERRGTLRRARGRTPHRAVALAGPASETMPVTETPTPPAAQVA